MPTRSALVLGKPSEVIFENRLSTPEGVQQIFGSPRVPTTSLNLAYDFLLGCHDAFAVLDVPSRQCKRRFNWVRHQSSHMSGSTDSVLKSVPDVSQALEAHESPAARHISLMPVPLQFEFPLQPVRHLLVGLSNVFPALSQEGVPGCFSTRGRIRGFSAEFRDFLRVWMLRESRMPRAANYIGLALGNNFSREPSIFLAYPLPRQSICGALGRLGNGVGLFGLCQIIMIHMRPSGQSPSVGLLDDNRTLIKDQMTPLVALSATRIGTSRRATCARLRFQDKASLP